MKILKVSSKKNGTFNILLDEEDYLRATTIGRTSRWCARVCKNRKNLVYFQKRLSGGKLIELHRLIMGFPENKIIDHINGNTLDNRRNNLRICSNSENIIKGKLRTNNKSGVSGVRFDKERKKWTASIKIMYKQHFLGQFKTKKEAIMARKEAEKEYVKCTDIRTA